MPRNRFEQVDERQSDAITLALWKDQEQKVGTVTFPTALSGGKVAADETSEKLPAIGDQARQYDQSADCRARPATALGERVGRFVQASGLTGPVAGHGIGTRRRR